MTNLDCMNMDGLSWAAADAEATRLGYQARRSGILDVAPRLERGVLDVFVDDAGLVFLTARHLSDLCPLQSARCEGDLRIRSLPPRSLRPVTVTARYRLRGELTTDAAEVTAGNDDYAAMVQQLIDAAPVDAMLLSVVVNRPQEPS